MAKRELTIIDDEDGGRTLAPASTKTADPSNPIDAQTGEPTFDSLNSRFDMSRPGPRAAGADTDDPVDEDGNIVLTDDDVDELFPKKAKKKVEDEEDFDDEDDEEQDEDAPVDSRAEEDEEDEDELDEPSPRARGFKGRLERERRLRREAEANFEDLRGELNELRAKVEGQSTESDHATKQKELTGKITAKQAELKIAMEVGETDKVLTLQDELDDLKYERRRDNEQYEQAKELREQRKTTATPIVLRKVDQWKRKHPRYNADPAFAGAANGIDAKLAARGIDPASDEYYRELDKELAKIFPGEYKGRREREQRRHPSVNQRNEGDGTRRPTKKVGSFEVGKGGRVKLTKFDVQTMRTFNLDPDNPDDVREYVRNNS